MSIASMVFGINGLIWLYIFGGMSLNLLNNVDKINELFLVYPFRIRIYLIFVILSFILLLLALTFGKNEIKKRASKKGKKYYMALSGFILGIVGLVSFIITLFIVIYFKYYY